MTDDAIIQTVMKRYEEPPDSYALLFFVHWDGGDLRVECSGKPVSREGLRSTAAGHFGRQSSSFGDETLVAFAILRSVLPAGLAEKYMIAFREFLFRRSWVQFNLCIGARWVMAWLTLHAFDDAIRPFILWAVDEGKPPEQR